MTCVLEDRLDELGEDGVERSEIGPDDDYEEENDSRQLYELGAVRPLDSLKLGPNRLQELENPTALAMLGAARAVPTPAAVAAVAVAAVPARAAAARRLGPGVAVGELLVVDLEVRRGRLRVARRELRLAEVLGRSADLEVDVLLELLALRVTLTGGLGAARVGAVAAALSQPLGAALGLTLLRALSLLRHRASGSRGGACACRTSGSTCAARSGSGRCASTSLTDSCAACTPRMRGSRRYGRLPGPLLPREWV